MAYADDRCFLFGKLFHMNPYNVLLILLAAYGLIVAGMIWALSRLRATRSNALFLGFLIFGISGGVLSAALWPLDSSVYVNLLGVSVGDWLYGRAIEIIGNPLSDQAHYTIPVFLRVPLVYLFASVTVFGVTGGVFQSLWNRRQRRVIKHHAGKL